MQPRKVSILSCEGMLTTSVKQVTWKLIRESGRGVPIFKADHSRFAAFSTLGQLVQDNRFQEVHTLMQIDGVLTAVGGFHQALIGATACQAGPELSIDRVEWYSPRFCIRICDA